VSPKLASFVAIASSFAYTQISNFPTNCTSMPPNSGFHARSCVDYKLPSLLGIAVSALTLFVRHQEDHLAFIEMRDELQAQLSVWTEVQMICIWPG